MSASLPLSLNSQRPASFLSSHPRAAAIGLVLLLAHVPLLFLHIRSLSEWSDYQFFPYAILAASFLAVLAFKSDKACKSAGRDQDWQAFFWPFPG